MKKGVKKKKKVFAKSRPLQDESGRKFKALFSAKIRPREQSSAVAAYLEYPKLKKLAVLEARD